MVAIRGPYSAALHDYVRGTLGFESDLPYEILTGRVHPWSYAGHENRFVDVGGTLAAQIRRTRLRVLIASGFFDLATPYFATQYTVDHLGLPPELRDRVRTCSFESGHMMYIHEPSLAKLTQEAARFYAESLR